MISNTSNPAELAPVLASLVPPAETPRKHSAAQIDQIAASMAEFGFTNPIMVDGNNRIIVGYGRYLAAKKRKLETVPVIVLEHLTRA
jgi:ParB-like chromosome segregation protein Spo0J